MGYKDVSAEYTKEKEYNMEMQQYFIDSEGARHEVDGKYVVLDTTEREIEVAKMLGKVFGGQIDIILKVNNPENIKTPDYIIDGEKFDLKEIQGNSKNTLYNAIAKQRRQADNFVFDISKTQISLEEAIIQVQNIFKSKHIKWVDRLIIVENNEILRIYKRD